MTAVPFPGARVPSPLRGRRRISAAGACIVAGVLLSMSGVSHAANSYMAEMDIMEFKGDKIGPVPALVLASTDGRTVNLRDLKGRSLLLVFWAST